MSYVEGGIKAGDTYGIQLKSYERKIEIHAINTAGKEVQGATTDWRYHKEGEKRRQREEFKLVVALGLCSDKMELLWG